LSAFGSAIALGPGEGRSFSIGQDRVSFKGATEYESGFAVVEYLGVDQPGPPLHVHRTFEECWFIVEGEVDFTVAGERVRGRTGSFFLVPRGVPHTFQVVGRAARWIGIFSPARYERLIEELGALIPAHGPPDPVMVAALFAAYDTDILEGPVSYTGK
jgi:mannose-6-phosphate isomerase-like protein (cupin superfamily)